MKVIPEDDDQMSGIEDLDGEEEERRVVKEEKSSCKAGFNNYYLVDLLLKIHPRMWS